MKIIIYRPSLFFICEQSEKLEYNFKKGLYIKHLQFSCKC